MTRDEAVDGLAQAYVDAIAERDAMTPAAAARAALPNGTSEQLAHLESVIADQRESLRNTA